jgi:hypothetical protein
MFTARHFLPSFLVVSLFCFLANAQEASQTSPLASPVVPRLVNFSGRATDTQGKTISGIAGATFAIYKEESGGSALWLETQNIQADAKGSYTVRLGSTRPDGLPLDLFSSGEARWLGVTVNGGQEQPRVLLLSVPYALKAADAETVGGLPPSAFVLAAPPNSGASAPSAPSQDAVAQPLATGTTPVTTAGGTVNKLAKFDASADITNSLIFDNGTNVGINTAAPASTLDVNGTGTVRGNLSLPATGTATATVGKNSQPTTLTASSFNSGTAAAVSQNFRLQAEPMGNNTASPSGTLNLLYGAGTNAITETGLKIASNGKITFAAGQAFPGTGTVTSVGLSAPGTDFTVSGSPVTKSGTLALKWNVAPTSVDTANAIVKRDSTGSFAAGTITVASVTATPATGIGIFSTSPDNHGIEGVTNRTGAFGVVGENNSSSGAGVFGAGPVGVEGTTSTASSYGVEGVNTATGGIGIHGSAPNGDGFFTENNVQQSRTAGGWVKAMALVDQNGVGICFNSTLIGAPATVSPCGFAFHAWGAGDYTVDFGFEVDDRFVSATGATGVPIPSTPPAGFVANVCVNGSGGCPNTITPNQVEVVITCSTDGLVCSNNFADDKVYLVIY